MHALLVHLLFFLSGAAGLIYEVIWVRQFGSVFGSTVYSVALVTGLYMCGLGVGGWLAGAFADARFREDPVSPLRIYGRFELAIAVLALSVALLLPHLGALSAAISTYAPDAQGWDRVAPLSSFARYALAVLLLTPITLLMGATLPLLIRYVVSREVDSAGFRIGVLYGVNTAGAALGCLSTDLLLVPALGLLGSQTLAALCNALAGASALLLARVASRVARVERETAPAASGGDSSPGRPRVALVSAAIALTGFAAMGMQVVWFRHFVSLYGGYRSVFSLLLTVILVGIWLGSLLGGVLARKVRRPAAAYAVSQALFVATALVGLFVFQRAHMLEHVESLLSPLRALGDVDSAWADWRWAFAIHWSLLRPALLVVGIPMLFMGVAYPLANAQVQDEEARVGGRAGLLYLANTLGGVLGSLVGGFLLLPAVGVQHSTLVLVTCAAASVVPLHLASRSRTSRAWLVPTASLAVAATALVWSFRLPGNLLVFRPLPSHGGYRILSLSEDVNETIAILEFRGGVRKLITNAHSMSSTSLGSQRYMRAFAHVPLLLHDDPADVMIMCFGVGNTLHATLLHDTVAKVDMVDYSSHVLEHAGWFKNVNGGALGDERVRVRVNDARQHLRMQPEESYDVITGEPPPIAFAGVVGLYTREFFELARSRLKPGGMLSYWLPVLQVSDEVTRGIIGTFVDVFPDAVLLTGYRAHLILLGRRDARAEIEPARLDERLAANEAVRRDLARVYLGPLDLLGSFVASADTMRQVTADAPRVTDDRPLLEYGPRSLERRPSLPRELFAPGNDPESWCPACFAADDEATRKLRAYLDLMQRFYTSEEFLAVQPGQDTSRLELPEDRDAQAAAADSRYLRHLAGRWSGFRVAPERSVSR